MKHPVPDAALDADIATIAQKGAGKTYTNRGLVERLLDQGRRVVVMDPLNSWWGLKALANGKAGYAVAIIGGPNADVPLDPKGGENLGAFIAGAKISVVIDVSELKRAELIRFSNDFLAALYRLNRDPLWLVLEEADVFAPQQPMGDATMLLHQVDQIARRGRARGFRLWSITQRPAKLHKDILTQTSTLIMLRLRSPQDRAAAEAWIVGNAEGPKAREIVASLASLPVGEGWVWSPDHDILERTKFPPIRTLDTSATPQAGDAPRTIGKLASVDLGALREALTPEPTPPTGTSSVKPPVHRVEIVTGQQLAEAEQHGYDRGYTDGLVEGEKRGNIAGQALALTRARNALDALRVDQEPASAPTPLPAPRQRPVPQAAAPTPARAAPEGGDEALSGPQRQLLGAIAWWVAMGHAQPSKAQVAAIAGWRVTSGHLKNIAGSLRTKGLISYPSAGAMALTDTGSAAAPKPDTSLSFHDQLRSTLSGPQRQVFDCLLRSDDPEKSRELLARQCGWEPTSGHVKNILGSMRTLEIIDYPSPGMVALQPWVKP